MPDGSVVPPEPGVVRHAGEAGDETEEQPARRLLLFAVGARVYGCEIDWVREIIPFRRCTRLPGAPGYVCGVINLRGTLVTVVDLGLRLGAQAVDRAEGSVILVEAGGRTLGLGVDGVRDVQPIDRAALAALEAAHGGGGGGDNDGDAREVVRGLGRVGEEVVILLDVQTIVRQVLL